MVGKGAARRSADDLYGLEKLARSIREQWPWPWPADGTEEVEAPHLATVLAVLETAFAASLTREEARQTAFGVLLADPTDLEGWGTGSRPDHIVPFGAPIPYTAAELRRLAPATDPTHVLIAVCEAEPAHEGLTDLVIWGLVDIGQSWWRFVRHKSAVARLPPRHLLIASNEPGGLDVHRSGHRIAGLRQGRLVDPYEGGLWGGPLSDVIRAGADELYHEVTGATDESEWDQDDADYPRRVYRQRLERLLIEIEALHHGGAVLMVPDAWRSDPDLLRSVVDTKYVADDGRLWDHAVAELRNHREYFDLHLELLGRTSQITPQEYGHVSVLEDEARAIEGRVDDAIAFVASLSGVDGAVAITDRLHLIGFGAEVVAPATALTHVLIARDAAADDVEERPISDFGTRHRSMFRCCWNLPQAIGFVISQDGGIKGVRRIGDDVVVWPNAVGPLDL